MPDDKYISCVGCHEPLLYEEIDSTIGITVSLPYCDNKQCPRYGLYTAVVEDEQTKK